MKNRLAAVPLNITAPKISNTIKLCPATFGFANDIYIYICVYEDNLTENGGSGKPPSRYRRDLKFGSMLVWASSRNFAKFQVPDVILTLIF